MQYQPHSDSIQFPTPELQQLFPMLHLELGCLRYLLGDVAKDVSVPPDVVTHARMLERAEWLFDRNYPALALFLAYPTQRLSLTLVREVADATATIAWLAQHPPAARHYTDVNDEYAACCERIQSGISDWRLSVDIKRAMHDLEYGPPEPLH